jgi:hypothetical protein
MDIGAILLVASYAYLLSALVRFFVARSSPSIEEERKKRVDSLYGREETDNQKHNRLSH